MEPSRRASGESSEPPPRLSVPRQTVAAGGFAGLASTCVNYFGGSLLPQAALRTVIPASIALGIVWNIIAVRLMGGRWVDAFSPSWLLAGANAGVVAGIFTIWSRLRRDGKESVSYGLATYYLGIFVYWISFVAIQRVILCAQHGGWTDFDLRDHLELIVLFLLYGTVWFGIFLIPLSFLSRHVLWKIYLRTAA